MQSLLCSLPRRRHHQNHRRSFFDLADIKHLRDRGLDHAVEREKNLKPVLNVKNLIKSEPAKSLPLSIISQQKDSLKIPTRPIDFIRRYPSIFQEFFPGNIGIHPHIKLTPQVLELDAEEQLVYQSESYRQDVANRLLKLLMISRIDKLPLKILDDIKWDLGLPQDYVKSVVPEFLDYFRVIGKKNLSSGLDSDLELELVCWSNDLAVSVMEKRAKYGEIGSEKGVPFAFPMQFSRGFEIDKQLKKWLSEWQKLPYISPYENATHLGPNSNESDKWAVGILHEVLNLFVSKKVERDTLLLLGEWLGIRSRFKKALLHHPGIFYLSSKMGNYTVVLRDAYKRGLLIEMNAMMNIRNQYIHLMHSVTEDHKAISVPGGSKKQEKKMAHDSKGQEVKEGGEASVEVNDLGSDFEDDTDDDLEYDDDEEHAERNRVPHRNSPTNRQRMNQKNSDVRRSPKDAGRGRSIERQKYVTKDKVPLKPPSRIKMRKGHGIHRSTQEMVTSPKSKRKLLTEKRTAA